VARKLPIPSWEANQLDSLSQQGKLYGVSPQILGAIDLAESHGEGGYANREGYGGWFGLSQSDINLYGGGASLKDTSQQSFDVQAATAAGIFAKLLAQHGGNIYTTEEAYQGGSHEGANIFSEYGITNAGGGSVTGSGGGTGPGSQSNNIQPASNNVTPVGNTMQADIFNALQQQLPLPFGNLDPLNLPFTVVDWILANTIPLLIAAVLVAFALLVAWKELGKSGVGHGLEDMVKGAARDAARGALIGAIG